MEIRNLSVIGVVLLVTGCHVTRGDPVGFHASLECGLSQQEVATAARQFGAPDVGCPPPPSVPRSKCFVGFGRFVFDLEFDPDAGLTKVVRGEQYSLKGLDLMPEEDLCMSTTTPQIIMRKPARF